MCGAPDHFAVELVPKPIFAFLDNLGEGETFFISSIVFFLPLAIKMLMGNVFVG